MLNFGFNGQAVYDYNGNLTDRNISLFGYYQGPLQSSILVNYSRIEELYAEKPYELGHFVLHAKSSPKEDSVSRSLLRSEMLSITRTSVRQIKCQKIYSLISKSVIKIKTCQSLFITEKNQISI